MRKLSVRLGKPRSTAAVDSGGDRAVERMASSQLGASSGVQWLAGGKRAGFDLREEIRVSEDSDLPSEEMEDSRSEDRVLPWGT